MEGARMTEVSPEPRGGSYTLGEELTRLAPGETWLSLARWPPDVFAVTSQILADSGAYRLVICPPEGRSWPPSDSTSGSTSWGAFARSHGSEWAAWVESLEGLVDIEPRAGLDGACRHGRRRQRSDPAA